MPARCALQTTSYASHITAIAAKARSVIRDLDPTNDLTFLRLRSKKHEIMVAPGASLTVLPDPWSCVAWLWVEGSQRACCNCGGRTGRGEGCRLSLGSFLGA